jgi:hypothetical protein
MALSESALSELLVALTDRDRGVDLVRELAQYLAGFCSGIRPKTNRLPHSRRSGRVAFFGIPPCHDCNAGSQRGPIGRFHAILTISRNSASA